MVKYLQGRGHEAKRPTMQKPEYAMRKPNESQRDSQRARDQVVADVRVVRSYTI